MTPTYWVALQHFRPLAGRPASWYACKVCSSRERARGFDDCDPAADAFKVVGWASDRFGDDTEAALTGDYQAVRDAVEEDMGRLAAAPAGGTVAAAEGRRR